jgi:hypothetical protein
LNRRDKYINGLSTSNFIHIPEPSRYNSNYYIGLDKDLLYAKSDDDNTTEWWLIIGATSFFLGESYVHEDDLLHRSDQQGT